jgi:tetratricopeptide (TPR) repeat protein
MMALFLLLPALVLGGGQDRARGVAAGPSVAQAFGLPEGEEPGADPAAGKPAPKAKPPPKKKEVKSEEDLWSTDPGEPGKPAGEKPAEDVEDVEQEGDPSGEDRDPGLGGGWGAKAEQDAWGDEAYQPKGGPRPGERQVVVEPAPGVPKPDAGPPGGASAQPGVVRIPGVDGGLPPPAADADALAPVPLVAPGQVSPEGGQVIRPPSGSLADLGAIWEQRRLHLEQRDFELAGQGLERFLALKEELGIRNMPAHSLVLLREAGRDRARGDARAAEQGLAAARRLSPEVALFHLEAAWQSFRASPWALGEVFGPLGDAAASAWRDPLTRNRWLANGLLGLLLGLGLAIAVFVVVQCLRYLRLFLHDFHHLFPRGAARIQTGILAGILLLLPVFLRAGLLVSLLTWLLVAWIYQTWRERILSMACAAVLGLSPLALEQVVGALELPRSPIADLLAVERGPAPADSLARLRMGLEARPRDPSLLASLGGFHKRAGDLGRARELLERAVESRPEAAFLHNNLGNVYFLQGETGPALERYKRATDLEPALATGYFNMSRAFFRTLQLEKGKQARQQAIQLDQELMRELTRRAESGQANGVVADLPLPDDWLRLDDGWASSLRTSRAELGLWRSYTGTTDPRRGWFYLGGTALLALLLALGRTRMFSANACVRCGRPVCRRCDAELRDDSVCGQCFHAFVRKDKVDARVRISKEIQVRQYRARVETLARALSFVLPGVGQLLKDRPLRGMLILTVCALAAVQLVFWPQVLRGPWADGAAVDWLKLIPLAALLLAFYLWAVLDAFRAEG